MWKYMGRLNHPSLQIRLQDYGDAIPPTDTHTPSNNHSCVGGTDVFRIGMGRLNFGEVI